MFSTQVSLGYLSHCLLIHCLQDPGWMESMMVCSLILTLRTSDQFSASPIISHLLSVRLKSSKGHGCRFDHSIEHFARRAVERFYRTTRWQCKSKSFQVRRPLTDYRPLSHCQGMQLRQWSKSKQVEITKRSSGTLIYQMNIFNMYLRALPMETALSEKFAFWLMAK